MMWASIFYFILTLLLLIIVHEFGHFIVARWCGVKVLRFSFGFGKVIRSWRDSRGTEFVFSLVPLGGYVKLLDENESPVPVTQRPFALNRQPLWRRFAIVLAGPVFNFILAFVLLWCVAVIGIKSFAPRIAEVRKDSIAALAQLRPNQEVLAINDKKINNWRDVHYVLMPLLGTSRQISISLQNLNDQSIEVHYLSLKHWKLDPKRSDLLESLGIVPLFPKVPNVIDVVSPHSAAERAGLKMGDEVLAIDQYPMVDWLSIVQYIKPRAGETIQIEISREHKKYQLPVRLDKSLKDSSGVLGIGARAPSIPKDWLRMERSGPIDALSYAFLQTAALTGMTFQLMGQTIVGHLSLQHLSGPVGIAKAAAESVQMGWVYYLFFVALLSISIGVLNLLPIPMLDGGHLLYYTIEAIIRRPLSTSVKVKGAYVGMVFIVILTLIALSNDLR